MEVTCKYCKHRWDWNGIGIYAKCSRCSTSNQIYKREELEKNQNEIENISGK